MAKEEASITFYRITQCGYYAFGDPEPRFGSLEEALGELDAWGRSKTLRETYLFKPVGDELPVYLFDTKSLNGDWLIAMWNAVPSTNQSVASVQGNSKVGNADVQMTEYEEGRIPGFATYFWLLPKHNMLATIRFQHNITAQKALAMYIESFMEFASSHSVTQKAEGEKFALDLLGHVEHPEQEDAELQTRLTARFRTALKRRPGEHELIRKNVDNISRVERNTLLQLNKAQDLAFWQNLVRFSKINEPAKRPERMRLRYRMTTPVTEQDVNEIIEAWESSPNKQWDDYGFVFRGSSEIHWLSNVIARKEFELDIDRLNDEVVDLLSLLKALNEHRTELLALAED